MKKFISTILIIFIVLLNLFAVYAGNVTAQTNHIDAVLVIDTSNSMNGNDPSYIAVEGVKLFVDMMESSGSRVAVIGFNGQINFETSLLPIDNFSDKQKLHADINKIRYVGQTDIGMALKRADAILATQSRPERNPMVIMFTDGYIEFDNRNGRSEADSYAEVDQVILGAKNNYPIYTVGLNKNDRVDKELIEKIADETNAKNYMTNDPKDLPEIFNEIFARHIKSTVLSIGSILTDGTNYNLIDINIPNSSVIEANIIMFSSDKLIDARLENPSGRQLPLRQTGDIYYTTSNNYSMIKIISPEPGNWKLRIRGVRGDQVKINLLFNYDILLEAYTNNQAPSMNETIEIKGKLLNNGVDVTDTNLVSSFNAELEVFDSTGNTLDTIPMTLKGTEFVTSYIVKKGEYNFRIKAAGAGFYRESNVISLNVTNTAPKIVKPIESKILLYMPILKNTATINLNDVFEDEDGDELTYSAEPAESYILADVDDNLLKLSTDKVFAFDTSDVSVVCTDARGSTEQMTFSITIIPLVLVLAVLLVIAALLIALPLLLKKMKENNVMFTGKITAVVIIEGINNSPKFTDLRMFKGCLTTDNLIENEGIPTYSELQKLSFIQTVSSGRPALAFTNNSKLEVMQNYKLDKKFVLEQNKNITIKDEENNILIRINYDKN